MKAFEDMLAKTSRVYGMGFNIILSGYDGSYDMFKNGFVEMDGKSIGNALKFIAERRENQPQTGRRTKLMCSSLRKALDGSGRDRVGSSVVVVTGDIADLKECRTFVEERCAREDATPVKLIFAVSGDDVHRAAYRETCRLGGGFAMFSFAEATDVTLRGIFTA